MTTYLYVHYFNGEARYVGIGSASRPFNFRSRNRVWLRVRAKYGDPDVQFLGAFDTREEACAAEVRAIADLKAMGARLVNLTSGGDSGGTLSPETRMLMSAAHLTRDRPDQERESTAARSRRAWSDPETRAKLEAAIRTAAQSPEARAAAGARSRASMANPKTREAIAEKLTAVWSDQARRDAMREQKRSLMRTPEKRAQMSELAKAVHARRSEKSYQKGPVMREDTGEVFGGLTAAARAAEVSNRIMREHLNGERATVKGAVWRRVV